MKARLMLSLVAVLGLFSTSAVAQVVVVGPFPILPPTVVAHPLYVPAPVSGVSAYRPIVPTYVAPATYSAYRPAYVAPVIPVAPVPTYGSVVRYRTGVVGPGLGGIPSVYTPGQPVRNALRYIVP
jgi:hypothetical protein